MAPLARLAATAAGLSALLLALPLAHSQSNGTSVWACAFVAPSGALALCSTTGSAYTPTCCDAWAGGNETAIAWGVFTDGIGAPTAGNWAQLAVHTSAAFAEPYLTAVRTTEFAHNVHGGGSTWSPALADFVEANLAYVARRVDENPGDPFWRHVGLAHAQQAAGFEGYMAAYAAAGKAAPLSNASYYALTLIGDMDDLCVIFGCARTSSWRQARAAQAQGFRADDETIRFERSLGDGHCSALVKPLGSLFAPTDVLFGHTTWNPLETMTRIYKLYDFPWTVSGTPGSEPVPGLQISFSSFPACFYSFDDYYTTYPAALGVLETTIINNNASLWALVHPESVMDWARNMVANRLADDGDSWAAYFQRENSGTYNNMFLVLSYTLVKAAVAVQKPLLPGTLVVVEQMPGVVVVTDATPHLQPGGAGYYASYNRIATPWLFNLTNQTALVQEFGDHFSYESYSRAEIMRARQANVTDMASYRELLRYNDFSNDATGGQGCTAPARSGSNAISERGDLSPVDGCPCPGLARLDEAGIDAKVTNLYLMTTGPPISIVQNGPTFDSQPPFVWSTSPFASVPHEGQPDKWDFLWAYIAPDFPADAPLAGLVGLEAPKRGGVE